MKIRSIIVSLLMILTTIGVRAQITVGGNVYGGGNKGNVKGNSTVTVHAGTLNEVYGGARVADVGGRTFVNIDGEHATEDIFIKTVYGGNDIAGQIGQGDKETTVPAELENIRKPSDNTVTDLAARKKNAIDKTWKTFVRTSRSTKIENNIVSDDKAIVIGSLYGGGNGDYDYGTPTYDSETKKYTYTIKSQLKDSVVATKTIADQNIRPVLPKTYLEIKGGCIAHTYGGGNNATVTGATVINIDNEGDDLTKLITTYLEKYLPAHPEWTTDTVVEYLKANVGLTTFQSNLSSLAFNHARIYGGNNKATMNIMPTWNLQQGIIRDVYSGGNEGDMTHSYGLLLDIDPVESDKLIINNVYGGCRRADVRPLQADGKTPSTKSQIQLPFGLASNDGEPYLFPTGLSARTLVRGGQITNVYGGNDISGRVFGGNAVGIYTSILGDVYGGGNGSYAYTDNAELGKMDEYKDFYYTDENLQSVDALNIFRPNAEQVSIRLWGKSATNPTIIGGRVFLGGNSATLKNDAEDAIVELKIGSHVIADQVFLGNNGENMVDTVRGHTLSLFAGSQTVNKKSYDFSTIDLTQPDLFANYMEGCMMTVKPRVVFDDKANGDPDNYQDYSSYFGSFYCGGNVGSMRFKGSNTINVNKKVVIFDKFVGGCNNADVPASGYNTAYNGGVLRTAEEVTADQIIDKINLNISEMRLQPLRWIVERDAKDYATKKTDEKGNNIYVLDNNGNRQLEWNVISAKTRKEVNPIMSDNNADLDRRLYGANVYGGCCESGHVDGNVVVNINGTIVDREGEHSVFDTATPTKTDSDPNPDPDILYGHDAYNISTRRSGVILGEQGMDVLGSALTVFGGGKGAGTEVWGSTTVNINKGYAFKVFGGSESGVVGRSSDDTPSTAAEYTFTGNGRTYNYNSKYSTNVNLNCGLMGVSRQVDASENMADLEFIYGGGFEGLVAGNTYVHLDNGRLFNLFAGSCNADILGHTETYIGQNGFPYMRDHIYGGNDLGGEIKGVSNFTSRVRENTISMVHPADIDNGTGNGAGDGIKDVLQANCYVEYLKGKTKSIFGGCFGGYDYKEEFPAEKGYSIPLLHGTFVNIRPEANDSNAIERVFGAGEGAPGERGGDRSQDCSYVLIDIDDDMKYFRKTEVFGSGSNNGLGMIYPPETTFADGFGERATAVIDLIRGQIGNVFGGSHNEGVTRRTMVNVPSGSTIWMYSDEPDEDVESDGTKTKHEKKYGNIFGGAYGTQILPPCDVYESNVNYHSDQAVVNGSIFGGNNNERRTLFTHVNISKPVWSHELKVKKGYTAAVYGAGQGVDTWAEHTEVNLLPGANVYEVYGGGMMGHVLNDESVQRYMSLYESSPSNQIGTDDPYWKKHLDDLTSSDPDVKQKAQKRWADDWADAWTLGDYYKPDVDSDNDGKTDSYDYTTYVSNGNTNLSKVAERPELVIDPKAASQLGNANMKYNTNVIINEGATVSGYAYGGGYGKKSTALSGDVYGTTYLALLGGTVGKDIYGGGTAGSVDDLFGTGAYDAENNRNGFTASTNVYILGGTARNVYGGGWQGNIGAPEGLAGLLKDYPGETHVVIGKTGSNTFAGGDPAIQRNAFGGGEGGSVIGTANITLNNGHIGYVHLTANEKQDEKGAIVAAETSEGLAERYEEKINDETYYENKVWKGEGRLEDSGNLFGSGYDDLSNVDNANVTLYGGLVRNSVFGGGEVSTVGRGTKSSADATPVITKAGTARVTMFDGHVLHNVYGGGKGFNILGYGGNHKLYTDGYVFGQTRVNIHGGEIGTEKAVRETDEIGDVGNVFGGGFVGVVYSAYEKADGTLAYGKKSGQRYDDGDEGAYYKYENNAFVKTESNEKVPTEDCKVVVEPWLQAKVDFDSYKVGDYVPTSYLNTLPGKTGNNDTWPAEWDKVDVGTKEHERGVIIHNGVFAGGNRPVGQSSGNNTTIYGNATASIHDVYHRDLITIGTGRVGGLYGDGNLTFVDGYRELNITNYGTDFYHIDPEINRTKYDLLFPREQAYYEIRYKCQQKCHDKDGTEYHPEKKDDNGVITTNASTISAEELELLFLKDDGHGGKVSIQVNVKGEVVTSGGTDVLVKQGDKWVPNTATGSGFWAENGLRSRYAGRTMNTIQRADFCGVFGSRMEMLGAEDRVFTTQDGAKYTINRVREVSLNKKLFNNNSSDFHGNYFGIYNKVNYLGALTSDFDFGDETSGNIRETDNPRADTYKTKANNKEYGTATFYDWKKEYSKDNRRNNGKSHNELALASGVYLELTTDKVEGQNLGLYEKDWGLITGVVQLDLINTATGVGGGYVYAKNVHGTRSESGLKNTTLTALNDGAATKKVWKYIETDKTAPSSQVEFQTSGNFVHNTQTIIDDCYNIGNHYDVNGNRVPAHYWYIKGSIYIYDQYISAYTGVPNAYNENTEIPLTITAASNGRLKLIDVQPNLYAYYDNSLHKLSGDQKVIINDVAYHLNDTITYWDWSCLSESEQKLFVPKTYVNSVACYVDGTWQEAGSYVMNETDYNTFKSGSHTYKDINDYDVLDNERNVAGTDYVFRLSNNVSHNKGYILTYQVDNPEVWDQWYTLKVDNSTGTKTSISKKAYNVLPEEGGVGADSQDKYEDAPTYTPTTSGLYGQHRYRRGDIIPQEIETTYKNINSSNIPNPNPEDEDYEDLKQATFTAAYITTETVDAKKIDPDNPGNTKDQHYEKGAKLAQEEFSTEEWGKISGKVAAAFVCTSTIQISDDDYILPAELVTQSDITAAKNTLDSSIETLLKDKGINDATTISTIQGKKADELDTYLTDDQKSALGYSGLKSLKEKLTAKEQLTTDLQEAYYCMSEGMYGGDYYVTGNNYQGLEAWSGMSETERSKFQFNYDALDLLIDSTYYTNPVANAAHSEGHKYRYDGYESYDSNNQENMTYSLEKPVTYTATFTGEYKNDDNSLTTIAEANYPKYKTNGTGAEKTVAKNGQLTPAEFESIPNEQRHYTKISVADQNNEGTSENPDYKVYVVNSYFNNRNGSYAVGSTLVKDDYDRLSSEDKSHVTTLKFTAQGTYYYCRHEYSNGQSVASVSGVTAKSSTGADVTQTRTSSTPNATPVPVGLVIAESTYTGLPNQQKGFVINGVSPMETSTLYVSRDANILDLSKEKVITVIYQYDYEESNESGSSITPYSELHILNIHLQFKSGVPTISNIKEPGIVLPGTSVAPEAPKVTPGAYQVIGTGWELFRDPEDAGSGYNGKDYDPTQDELYWYQDKYHIAYYADTYLGRTYSNHVPVHVANYHDLKKVMDAKTHHYYIDEPNVQRAPKIYINDYKVVDEEGHETSESRNGLDLFKNLYDLSVLDNPATNATTGLISSGDFAGHKPLDTQVRAGRNLEFFLRTDLDHKGSTWTPIAATTDCFAGTLHGDGHTISGLDHSLFGNLCGDVYNLGVTGSFTGAGVADTGSGYVESCWISTTGTPASNVKPVFGNPSRTAAEITERGAIQIVNSYYEEEDDAANAYTNHSGNYGIPTRKPAQSFYNGEVAYDLNNFYLYKRYNDNAKPDASVTYKYWKKTGEEALLTGTYAQNAQWCSSGNNNLKYVEDRFKDGDFVYANGTIPDYEDERYYLETVTDPVTHATSQEPVYYPIWPDDYLFFGQSLTYNHVEGHNHQNKPSAINRSEDGRVLADINGNRVYRAPAFFRNSQMRTAYFNPYAVFAQSNAKLKPEYLDTVAYRNMTAIDFTGYHEANGANGTYEKGLVAATSSLPARFYPPLLDEDGLTSFLNVDLTQNLLVYTKATGQTADVVSVYLREPTYTEEDDKYHTVPKQEIPDINGIHGHWVAGTTATNDHLLVDKQDFNAPISYTFANDKRMWYQRMPDNYVDIEWSNAATPVRSTKGWEDVSLPFKAELVTTNQKGEITHFYGESDNSRNSVEKLGHEYWLREFKTGGSTIGDDIYKANFNYPAANSGDGPKGYANTFLWDYYYQYNDYRDKNSDKYQEDDANRDYYKKGHTYDNYPRLAAGTPYIIGFPGERYYEFDLSGKFIAGTAFTPKPEQLEVQTITFASKPGITINVSDDETGGVSIDGYNYKPSFLNQSFKAGTALTYTLNADGNSYNLIPATGDAVMNYAFRPYFVKTSSSRQTRSIVFSNNGLEQLSPDSHVVEPGILEIHAVGHNIVVTSSLKFTTDVRILNTAGLTLKTFAIRPGETIETRIFNAGVYIVQDEEGKYTKKLSVK